MTTKQLSEDERIKLNSDAIEKINLHINKLEALFKHSSSKPDYLFNFGRAEDTPKEEATGIDLSGNPLEANEPFYTNTSKGKLIVTITIKNNDEVSMTIQVNGDDLEDVSIQKGKVQTVSIEVPPGGQITTPNPLGLYEVISVLKG